MSRATGNFNTASVQLDEKEDIDGGQTCHSPDLLGEEIGGPKAVPVSGQELFPGKVVAFRRRREAVSFQDLTDEFRGDNVAEFEEFADDTVITPNVFLSEAKDQGFNNRVFTRTSGSLMIKSPFFALQFTIPFEEGFGFDDGKEVRQEFADGHAKGEERAAIIVGEWDAALEFTAVSGILS